MRRLFVLSTSGALLAVLAVVTLHLNVASAASAASPTTSPSLMSAYDLTQFGFDVNASSSTVGAQVDSATAIATAERATGATEPQEVIHSTTARVSPAGPARTVWIVLFLGAWGGDMPAGPAPDRYSTTPLRKTVFDYTGVVVDDQTGAVLYAFMSGHQQ
jgi:hypothetical protein